MRKIAVLTSGGDAPGMNAAVRAVTRAGLQHGWSVLGVRRGYAGLLEGDAHLLGDRDVGGILHRGGTFLGSARCPAMHRAEGRARAMDVLRDLEVDGLVVVGGDGSLAGALELSRLGVATVGVPATIDNDVGATEISLGVDSALNVALEAIDRLKATASSHGRVFLVEVMGRESGYLALTAGIAGGAEAVVVPEVETDPDDVAAELWSAYERGKAHAIVVVAEGAAWNVEALATHFREHRDRLGFELRRTVLGHVQRGAAPGAFDRLLGGRLGAAAVDALSHGRTGSMVGLDAGGIRTRPLAEVLEAGKPLDHGLVSLARLLAR